MKRNKKHTIFGILFSMLTIAVITSCSDWTDVESVDLDQANIANKNPELYAKYLNNLREYKKSDHTLVYVWFDNSEKTPFTRAQHIIDLPDSVDIVGMIHPDNLTDWELKEMAKIRTDKATKVIYSIDFESIKAAYNTKLELATEEEPVSESFVSFLIDSLGYSLSLANKYDYDGICITYAGKSRLHMRPDELKEYTANETAFINMVTDWHKRNPQKMISYEGKPQNLIDPSLLDDCLSILISGKEATNANALTYNLQLAVKENIPEDRYGMVVMATDLNDPNKKIGYFADGSLAIKGLADWAPIAYGGITVKAVGIYNVSTDYHTSAQDYFYTRELISSVNPSVK
ncbi:glycoside hydrolase family 18 [Bacteroides reticulotermitis]|uniref:glycoside hydrolase family 18 n=1 Tax=Bacteroides reticulotermitis TaxID=1133319 RepID=UPI003A875D02